VDFTDSQGGRGGDVGKKNQATNLKGKETARVRGATKTKCHKRRRRGIISEVVKKWVTFVLAGIALNYSTT